MDTLLLPFVVAALLAAPVPDDLAKPPDIQCQDEAKYIGGIDRVYSLNISGPKEKTWKYNFEMVPGVEKLSMVGSYEIVDGLAIFTGKANGKDEVRFGLNFARVNSAVEFNGFFPGPEQTLRYQRKWFRKEGADWKPAKEVVLTMPAAPLNPGPRQIAFKGEKTVWDAAGQPKRDKIDIKLNYRGEGEYFGLMDQPGALADVIPPVLMQHKEVILFGKPGGPDGFLRGFRPELATP